MLLVGLWRRQGKHFVSEEGTVTERGMTDYSFDLLSEWVSEWVSVLIVQQKGELGSSSVWIW
jgi:hypothetical protein